MIAEDDAYFKFQIEHIISLKHGGSSEPDNLALACVFCNRFKGSDIASIKPETDDLIRFYNPRTMRWHEHFRLDGVIIEPLTDIGEATVRILQMNHENQNTLINTHNQEKHYFHKKTILQFFFKNVSNDTFFYFKLD